MSDAVRHEQHEQAVALWRTGERLARRRWAPEWPRDYEAAIVAAVAVLQRYRTMDQLVAAYFDDAGDNWVEPLCRLPSGRVLSYGVVEDAAYWRRLQQLIGEQAGTASGGEGGWGGH